AQCPCGRLGHGLRDNVRYDAIIRRAEKWAAVYLRSKGRIYVHCAQTIIGVSVGHVLGPEKGARHNYKSCRVEEASVDRYHYVRHFHPSLNVGVVAGMIVRAAKVADGKAREWGEWGPEDDADVEWTCGSYWT